MLKKKKTKKQATVCYIYIIYYIYITESLCCTPETNPTLPVNYTSIKKLKKILTTWIQQYNKNITYHKKAAPRKGTASPLWTVTPKSILLTSSLLVSLGFQDWPPSLRQQWLPSVSAHPARPLQIHHAWCPHFPVSPTFIFGKLAFQSMRACQQPISHFPGWLLLLFYISTHILYDRDPVPSAHTPPVSPTSAPPNSLTACLAHLPCLRPPFLSWLSRQAPVSSAGLSVQRAAPSWPWLWQPDPRTSWAPRQLSTRHPLSGMQSSYFGKQVPEGQPGS